MTTTITAPDPNANGKSWFGPVQLEFKDGAATYDGDLSDGLRAYLYTNGFTVDGEVKAAEDTETPVDSRDVETVALGSPLRDAAVDPRPDDFLAPVNAGQADPHGPEVAAPGIHGANQKAVVPGPVGSVKIEDDKPVVDLTDTDAQDAKESQVAEATLVDGKPVHEAIADASKVDPINTDQPGVGDTSQVEDVKRGHTDDAGDVPKGNASRDEWVAYARDHGATDEELAEHDAGGLSRDELRDKYGPHSA